MRFVIEQMSRWNLVFRKQFANFVISQFYNGISGAESATSQQEIDRHLELGKQFLVNGQLSDALTHYHAAVGKWIELMSLQCNILRWQHW